ncbi:MAG: ABC transporter permease [Anaerolineales bacterium]|jgi:ABC-2 type transport system permease protein
MRLWRVFVKSLREQSRDLLTLSLSITLAPVFVFLYWLFFPSGGSTTYDAVVINNDLPIAGITAGEDLIAALSEVTYSDGQPILDVHLMEDQTAAETKIKDRKFEVMLVIPEDLSATIHDFQTGVVVEPAAVTFIGDLTNPYYAVAAVMANAGLEGYVQFITGEERPITVEEVPLGDSAGRTEFEIYVPGMLMFSIVILVFEASMVVAYEVESGTLKRLKITKVSTFELLGGISASVILIGVVGLLLAIATALALGFTSHGPLWVAILIGVITTISVIGVGLMIAAFSKTVSQAFIIANFPLVFFMFFTGVVFPIPGVTLFTIAGHPFGLYDFLPPTHAVVALSKVMTLGAGLDEVVFELSALVILSVIYFALGVWLFQRKHMRTT